MNAQIDGRVAVVTGGSSGIGFETLRLLLGEGAKVAFCGRDPDRLASAHATLQNEFPHGEIFSYRCDVLNADEVQAFADAVQARFGAADLLINNAGQGYVAHFHDTPREAWLHEAELKLFGVINPVQGFQPLLEQSDIASITCVNSLLALQPEEHMIATSAARAALLNMTLTLSKELVGKGIRVNSILLAWWSPGSGCAALKIGRTKARAGRSGRRISRASAAFQWRASAGRRSPRRRCCSSPRRWPRLPPAPRWTFPAASVAICKDAS